VSSYSFDDFSPHYESYRMEHLQPYGATLEAKPPRSTPACQSGQCATALSRVWGVLNCLAEQSSLNIFGYRISLNSLLLTRRSKRSA